MSLRAYRRVIDALEARDLRGRDHGAKAQYQCPSHEDRTPSLSITDRPDRALVNCQAGCDARDVLDALELDWPDLFDEPATGKCWTTDTLRRAGATANGNGRVTLGTVDYLPGATMGSARPSPRLAPARPLGPTPPTSPATCSTSSRASPIA